MGWLNGSGRGTSRAEDAQGTPTQSRRSPNILAYDIHRYIYVYIYIHICMHVSIYIYIYIHTYIHTYIHIHIYKASQRPGHAGTRSARDVWPRARRTWPTAPSTRCKVLPLYALQGATLYALQGTTTLGALQGTTLGRATLGALSLEPFPPRRARPGPYPWSPFPRRRARPGPGLHNVAYPSSGEGIIFDPPGCYTHGESGPLRAVHLSRHIIFHGLGEGICCPLTWMYSGCRLKIA